MDLIPFPDSLIMTDDGSYSSYDGETGELYHNRTGAYTEALHHYTMPSAGLQKLGERGEIAILDVCFGLGYNTFSFLNEAIRSLTPKPGSIFSITVVAIERDEVITHQIPFILKDPRLSDLKLFSAPFEHNICYQTRLSPLVFSIDVAGKDGKTPWGHVEFQLYYEDLRTRIPILAQSGQAFDLIFHDGFTPRKVPHLWTVDIFTHYHQLLQARMGRILTYSCSSAVRGGMIAAGFEVFKTRPVGRKSGGGTLAQIPNPIASHEPDNEWLIPLRPEDMKRLQTSAGIPYRDPSFLLPPETVMSQRIQEQEAFQAKQAGSEMR